MIRIYQEADYAAMSLRAAHIIAAEIYKNPACVLALPPVPPLLVPIRSWPSGSRAAN